MLYRQVAATALLLKQDLLQVLLVDCGCTHLLQELSGLFFVNYQVGRLIVAQVDGCGGVAGWLGCGDAFVVENTIHRVLLLHLSLKELGLVRGQGIKV